jgi:hypothetical protein
MKKAATFALVILLFLITSQAPALEPENYCDDRGPGPNGPIWSTNNPMTNMLQDY